jgi:hypothetical protein
MFTGSPSAAMAEVLVMTPHRPELDAAAERAGVKVQPGDAIVVRGGWNLAALPDNKVPGMTVDAIRWMHRHDVSL